MAADKNKSQETKVAIYSIFDKTLLKHGNVKNGINQNSKLTNRYIF